MDCRRELKHRINRADYHLLRNRLRHIMRPDPHSDARGLYVIRSLYFDSPEDKALWEKLDGVSEREKFRIRIYNGDAEYIRLEKKSKITDFNNKQGELLTREQAEALIRGDRSAIRRITTPLVQELYTKLLTEQLRPKTLVQYCREAYVYRPGNVRVTFDFGLKTGLFSTDLFDTRVPMVTPGDDIFLLEVKYDAFMPEIIAQLLQLGDRHHAAFSKYAACRLYG